MKIRLGSVVTYYLETRKRLMFLWTKQSHSWRHFISSGGSKFDSAATNVPDAVSCFLVRSYAVESLCNCS